MCDPLLKKGHAHRLEKYQPSIDEELDEYLEEEDLRLRQQQEEMWAQLRDEDEQHG